MKAEILTHSGKIFNILYPKPEMIDINDIAESLAKQCRFNGHIKGFYSVAEHSVRCSSICKKYPLDALMHDAAEAYTGDIVAPYKRIFPGMKAIEDHIYKVICGVFGLRYPLPKEVDDVDKEIMLRIEQEDLQWSNFDNTFEKTPTPIHYQRITHGMEWEVARDVFLSRFKDLTNDK